MLWADIHGWTVHAQMLAGDTTAARAALRSLDVRERAGTGMRVAERALELADRRPERANAVLAPVIASERAAGRSPQVVQPRWATVHALLLDAVARDELGDPRAAEASLERALGLAEPEGVILQFLLVEIGGLLERHRSHRHIYAKLDAHSRNEVVTRARRLDG